jgi:protein phosphatase
MTLKDKIEIFGLTDAGLVRDHNEDAIGSDQDLGLVVLADGMGGHLGGEVASAITVTTILETLPDSLNKINPANIDEASGYSLASLAVNDALTRANENVFTSANEHSEYCGMGTTVVVLLFYDNRLTVAHVGDSRLYRYRDGELELITRDHSLTQELVDRGFYTEEQARKSHNRNLVTRAVGIEETVQIDLQEDVALPGDIYLLCSDGITDMLEDKIIRQTIMDNDEDLEKIAASLISQANAAGGKDNSSAILARPLKPFPAQNSRLSRFTALFSKSGVVRI